MFKVTTSVKSISEETDAEVTESEMTEGDNNPKKFTLKQLIRTLHIDSPAEQVMCLLGKK